MLVRNLDSCSTESKGSTANGFSSNWPGFTRTPPIAPRSAPSSMPCKTCGGNASTSTSGCIYPRTIPHFPLPRRISTGMRWWTTARTLATGQCATTLSQEFFTEKWRCRPMQGLEMVVRVGQVGEVAAVEGVVRVGAALLLRVALLTKAGGAEGELSEGGEADHVEGRGRFDAIVQLYSCLAAALGVFCTVLSLYRKHVSFISQYYYWLINTLLMLEAYRLSQCLQCYMLFFVFSLSHVIAKHCHSVGFPHHLPHSPLSFFVKKKLAQAMGPPVNENVMPDAGTTWADRSNQEVIPVRAPRPKVSDAVKASKAIITQQAREKNEAFTHDLVQLSRQTNTLVEEMAKRHGKKPSAVRHILTHGSAFKKRRAPNLQNALVHAKALELNEGTRAVFYCLSTHVQVLSPVESPSRRITTLEGDCPESKRRPSSAEPLQGRGRRADQRPARISCPQCQGCTNQQSSGRCRCPGYYGPHSK